MVVCCLVLSLAPAQTISEHNKAIVSEKIFEVTYTMTFSENDFLFGKLKEYDTIQLQDGGYLTEPGKPMLPVKTIRLALPPGMKATTIRIIDIQEKPLDGTYIIFPAQPPQPIGTSPDDGQFIQPDAQTYRSRQSYPTKLIELTSQTDLAGQAIAEVTMYPMHYMPSQKKLTILTSIEFTVKGADGYVCGDYLSSHISASGRAMYEQMIKEMVVNPEVVELYSNNPQPIGVPPGDYDYVIITTPTWVSVFQPLADWKTKKGIPANIVTTDWIYNQGGYSGNNQQQIRSFIIDANANWGTTFFLLGGDTSYIPYYTRYIPVGPTDGRNIPTDTWYADFDDDWVCEVHIGRASVTGAAQISPFINKILTYEKNPPLTDYAKTAFFCGFDLYTYGSGEGEGCKEYIKNNYLSGWTYRYEYDSEGTNHRTEVLNNLNTGNNLVNHADHSDTDFMGTGYTNHGWGIDTNDAKTRTNGNKQSIIYSIGCWACNYPDAECIAEGFVRNANGGGIGFIGNSRYGWYNPYSSDGLSFRYDRYFFRSLLQQNNYKLGVAFTDHKNDQYPGDDQYYQYCFTELTLLGDPELPVWKENPSSLTVTHPSQLPLGSSPFIVHVTTGGNPVNQAYVCLWKGSEVYVTGFTNAAGDVTFNPAPTTTGILYVTVTKQNFLPYEGQATVISGNQPPSPPNQPSGPVKGLEETAYTYSTQTTDPENDDVYYMWDWGNEVSTWLGPYPSGTVVYAQHSWPLYGIYTIKVKAKDVLGAESDWSPPLQIRIYKLGDLSADNLVNFGDINPFVLALSQGEQGYYNAYPDGYYYTADCNQDGHVDFGDINPFVQLLAGG